MTRVALDLLGGDDAPASVVDGALLVLDEQPGVDVLLVGPPEVAAALLEQRRPGWADELASAGSAAGGRLRVVAASQVVGMDEDPARAVRAKRDATVRVAARLVRDGEADAVVSVGSTGAALAAAVFTLGRLRGVSRPPLAAVVPAQRGTLIFVDAGATLEATPELLAQFALAGAAFAQVRLGLEAPRVGLLSIGEEAGKGDALRKEAYDVLAALPLDFVGNVEGGDVPRGGVADVVVSDGFTGNVLIKGLEGAAAMLSDVVLHALRMTPEWATVGDALTPSLHGAISPMLAEHLGGAVLLGVKGVVVVGHGASSARAVASCVAIAVQACEDGLVPRVAAALAELADRRADATERSTPAGVELEAAP